MNNYKFRGKSTVNKKWKYGNLLYPYGTGTHCYIVDETEQFYEVLPETIGQLAIKTNTKEFYEGDIGLTSNGVKFLLELSDKGRGFYATEIGGKGKIYLAQYEDFDILDAKRIGNIHENPEILEDK